MEQYIPLLIGLAIFAFKTYNNFQKEQEKARNRKPANPVRETEINHKSQFCGDRSVVKNKPEPFLVEEEVNPNNPYEPKYKHLYKEPKTEEKVREDAYQRVKPAASVKEAYSETPAEEVISNRIIHKPHLHSKSKTEKVAEEVPYQFDIRDAIIKEAILNRPKF